ncbi:MAG: hypothetical protein K0Q79_3526 [Flavipsychrobacter sp.]|jgi:hypothetical protein|nr:hypothetical protein [Flavipsychrobacter sp.]
MKKILFIAFLSIILIGTANMAGAQDYKCYKAWKKDWKADKKESKINKKMFRDRHRAASKKKYKSYKKSYKTDKKEWEHRHHRDYDYYW